MCPACSPGNLSTDEGIFAILQVALYDCELGLNPHRPVRLFISFLCGSKSDFYVERSFGRKHEVESS
jgi:hypothetical protein